MTGSQKLLAFPPGRGRRVEHGADIGAGSFKPRRLLLGEPGRLTEPLGGEVRLGLSLRRQGLLQGPLEGPGNETVLGLDGVELAARPVGFEAGAFDGQLEDRDVSAVVGVGLGERLGGRRQAGRLEHGEDLFEHTVLEPATAEALATSFAAIEQLVATAEIARRVASRAGVARPASSARSVRSGPDPAAGRSLRAPRRRRGRAAPASWPGARPGCAHSAPR